MSKSRWGIIVLLACLATTITFAESFFSSSTPAPAQSSSSSGTSAPILKPDEFQNKVNNMGQQNKNDLDQQVKALLSKQRPTVPPPAPLAPSPSPVPVPAPEAGNTDQSTVTPPPPPQIPEAPTANSTIPSTTPAMMQQQQDQSYTGFVGTGGDNGKSITAPAPAAGSSTQQQSGGWNIKY